MQIDVLPVKEPQETLEQLKRRVLDGLANAPSVDVTEEALVSVITDLPPEKSARAEAIGGALLSPIEPTGGGCRFYRMNTGAHQSASRDGAASRDGMARDGASHDGVPAFTPPLTADGIEEAPAKNG